jgi:plasmid stabilization system protein ParE
MRATCAHLLQFPRLGRRQKAAGVRKIGVERYPYNVYDLVDETAGEVVILSVRHMARAPRFSDI